MVLVLLSLAFIELFVSGSGGVSGCGGVKGGVFYF